LTSESVQVYGTTEGMSSRTTTAVVLGGIAALLIGWDVWLYRSPAPSDTISRVLFDGAREHPILPFAFGVLAGHFFWGLRPRSKQ
jgi:hypothetical protein